MKWYEGLNEDQRNEVLGYAIGYLDQTVKGACANDTDTYVRDYAIRLLDHLKSQVGEQSNAKKIKKLRGL